MSKFTTDIIDNSIDVLSKVPYRTVGKYMGMATLFILSWEHIGRKYEETTRKKLEEQGKELKTSIFYIRPSIIMKMTHKKSKDFFEWIGKKFAWISSYLSFFDLKDISITIRDVFKPTIKFMLSPFHMISGYVKKAHEEKNNKWTIYIGSTILIVTLTCGLSAGKTYYPSIKRMLE